MQIETDLFNQIALFEGIPQEAIPSMLRCLHAVPEEYAKGSFIRREGDPADFIGIVLNGTVQILQDTYDGRRNLTSALGPGAMFAEAFSCAGAPELPVSIMAATDCRILFLRIDRLLSAHGDGCGFHPILLRNLLQIMARKNMMLARKLSCVSQKTTAEKLLAFLNEQARLHHSPEFTIPYDRQALADYLGVDRSAMSAEISKLKKQGILETKGSYFRLLGS